MISTPFLYKIFCTQVEIACHITRQDETKKIILKNITEEDPRGSQIIKLSDFQTVFITTMINMFNELKGKAKGRLAGSVRRACDS